MIAKTAWWICLLCVATAGYAHGAKPFFGTITKIIDGDSMVIATRAKNIEVRLYGVDCPEYNQPFSAEARRFSNINVHGRRVLVTPYYYDTYGRLVALVTQGDSSLNNELVRAGLAWVYPRYCRKSFCKVWKEDEQDAKRQKRGLWSVGGAVSPWDWKRTGHDS